MRQCRPPTLEAAVNAHGSPLSARPEKPTALVVISTIGERKGRLLLTCFELLQILRKPFPDLKWAFDV